ncbi:Dual specificity protein phosphatase, putative [Hondaea fermentalgiana]|uniref:protein-tyrosine-phosphatase n=1 Tax=Hondaea fermentalgiana TaxID=2315210 RepID=A0A2R5GMP6_9STRA|nr:Dual specificity protein phosphatase, putative [Hondaea fermentalgiana]|eukprot:GBG32160.1 Dual specificity protein phosphatase, putative [Hondaea fermentalgiana]
MGNSSSAKDGMGQNPSQVVQGHLFVGNRLDGMAAKMGNPRKFTHILCVEESSRYPNPESKIEFMLEPLKDDGSSDLEEFFDKVQDFLAEGVKTGRVLVHCTSGVNRGPTVAVLYLMKYWNYDLESAMRVVRRQRDGVNIHPDYIEQLTELSEKWQNSQRRQSKTKRIPGGSPP